MAQIKIEELTPPVREMEQSEMKSVFGGIIVFDGSVTVEPGDTFSPRFSRLGTGGSVGWDDLVTRNW